MLKYLRIAVTAVSLMACMLLIALWVRSYWCADVVDGFDGSDNAVGVVSDSGVVGIYGAPTVLTGIEEWNYETFPPDIFDFGGIWGFSVGEKLASATLFAVPYWFILSLIFVTAAIPWIHWSKRFSLRTLLIATTVVAVVLGLIVIST